MATKRTLQMSDDFLFGNALTLTDLNPRTEAEAAGDEMVDWELLEETRADDDALFEGSERPGGASSPQH